MVWLPFVWNVSLEPWLCVIGKCSPLSCMPNPICWESAKEFKLSSCPVDLQLLILLPLQLPTVNCVVFIESGSRASWMFQRLVTGSIIVQSSPRQDSPAHSLLTQAPSANMLHHCGHSISFLTKLNFYWTFVFFFCQFSLFLSFLSASSVYTFKTFMLVFVSEHMCGAQGLPQVLFLRLCPPLFWDRVSHWLRTYLQG